MTEAEIETLTPTEPPTETEEHVENPAAVLKKNRELLADLAKLKDRASQLEDLARDLGVNADALADPRATVTKRAEERQAADARARTIREAALVKIATEGRTVRDIEEVLAKVLADPDVKLENGKVTGLDRALKDAPRKAAPGLPAVPVRGWHEATGSYRSATAGPAPETFEQLVERGPEAIASYAREAPEGYAKLREDWQRRLANPGPRR
jgi:hypothetical protein